MAKYEIKKVKFGGMLLGYYTEIKGKPIIENGAIKSFRTKSAALKFAKAYMRKH